jgi:hypothetical protein
VTAAAALLLSVRPDLAAEQVGALLTRSAVDANASSGCKACPLLRDRLSGWGVLDVTSAVTQALSGQIPTADALEPNDDAGASARTASGNRGTIRATSDFWDDQNDVYRIRLFPGQRLFVTLTGRAGTRVYLWRPGTRTLNSFAALAGNLRVARSTQVGVSQRLGYRVRADRPGFYYLQVKLEVEGSGRYTLSFAKLAPRKG